MEIESIIGGVSPLKARQATRGGKYAKKATSTSRRRGGFAASKGVRGGGGRNVGGYNVRTKFVTAPAWVKPTSTGFTPTKPTISEKIIGGDPKGTEGTEYRTLPAEKAKKGNEFADNCYNTDGSRKEGHTYYSELKGMNIACKWGGKSDGSFDYDKEGTDERKQFRTWQKTAEGVTTFQEWKDLVE